MLALTMALALGTAPDATAPAATRVEGIRSGMTPTEIEALLPRQRPEIVALDHPFVIVQYRTPRVLVLYYRDRVLRAFPLKGR